MVVFVCNCFPNTFSPKFAVVVVKKRINTRIFHEDRGELKNPPPGTVVDTDVTQPKWCVLVCSN